jgi:predicted RecA/RadA family phage recombinase
MTVAENRLNTMRAMEHRGSLGVLASTHIYQGQLVFVDATTGYATTTSNSGANKFFGVATAEADNSSGANAAINVDCWLDGSFELPLTSAAQTDVGKPIYCGTDNDDMSLTATNKSFVGVVESIPKSNYAEVAVQFSGSLTAT